MLTKKGEVDRSLHFQGGTRIPVWVTGSHLKASDILTYDFSLSNAEDASKSEWGFARVKDADGFWAIPQEEYLKDWKEVDAYLEEGPELETRRRLAGIPKAAAVCEDRYRLASIGLSGFAIYRSLRGPEKSNVDALIEPERFLELMEMIFEKEVNLFDMIARKGFHGIEFRDDWGDRTTSRMTLSLWRILLKPRYANLFKQAKNIGLHIWMSLPSGQEEFYGDLKEIGVDVIRIESPYEADMAMIGRLYRGKLAFAVCLDEMIEDGTIDVDRFCQVYECLAANGDGVIAHFTEKIPPKTVNKALTVLKGIDPKMISQK